MKMRINAHDSSILLLVAGGEQEKSRPFSPETVQSILLRAADCIIASYIRPVCPAAFRSDATPAKDSVLCTCARDQTHTDT